MDPGCVQNNAVRLQAPLLHQTSVRVSLASHAAQQMQVRRSDTQPCVHCYGLCASQQFHRQTVQASSKHERSDSPNEHLINNDQ
jgi:hypothetical protein